MMVPGVLPPELVALIHHIELDKAGWWDKSLQRMILWILYEEGQAIEGDAIRECLAEELSVKIDTPRLESQLDALVSSDQILLMPDGKHKITESARRALTSELQLATDRDKRLIKRFEDAVAGVNLNVDEAGIRDLWKNVQDQILLPFVHQHGARTYELITGQTDPFVKNVRFNSFLKQFPEESQESIREAIISFLDPNDNDVRSYILQELNAHFFVQSGSLSAETISRLDQLHGRNCSFTFFVDTNFLFSILELHDNPSNDAASSLLRLVHDVKEAVEVNLFVLPITLDEAKRVINGKITDLAEVQVPPNVGSAVKSKLTLDGLSSRWVEVCAQAGRTIPAQDYFRPYLRSLLELARKKDVELYNENLDSYRDLDEVVYDVRDVRDRQIKTAERPKMKRTVEHDVILWHFAKNKRPAHVDSPIEAEFWIVTVDFEFIDFDRLKSRGKSVHVPICVHPTALIQMLQFWVPRSPKFEEAIVAAFRLPFLFPDFDADAERVTLRILSLLSRFENVQDMATETVSAVLVNDALRQKIKGEHETSKQFERIREAIIQENKRLAEKAEAVQNLQERVAQSEDRLRNLREKKEESEQELLRKNSLVKVLRREARALKKKIKETETKLDEERDERAQLDTRIKRLERDRDAARDSAEKRRKRTRFLFVSVAIPVLAVVAVAEVVRVAVAPAFGSGPLLALVVYSAGLLLTSIAVDFFGSRREYIAESRIFRLFHRWRKWLFSALGAILLGVISAALYDWIKSL